MSRRGRPRRSTSAPKGPLSSSVPAPTSVVTSPICDGLHCRICASHVPRNGPSPPWMSPMKTLIRARWVVGAMLSLRAEPGTGRGRAP